MVREKRDSLVITVTFSLDKTDEHADAKDGSGLTEAAFLTLHGCISKLGGENLEVVQNGMLD